MKVNIQPRFEWPETTRARIPLLSNRPPFDFNAGLEPEDRLWRDEIVGSFKRGEQKLPGADEVDLSLIRSSVYEVAHRVYHVARVVQQFFDNPNFGNYADSFLESVFILLTWRSRIEDAHDIITELQGSFESPLDMLCPRALDVVKEIVGKVGFSVKRPEMVVELVRHFCEKFPDSSAEEMKDWVDEEVIDFLTSIKGIGFKSALCVLVYSLERDRFPVDVHIRRVLRRTGLLRGLFLEEGELEHRVFQTTVESFVPPSVRRPLHTGLLALGQRYCLPSRSQCDECPIRNICQYYRRKAVEDAGKRKLVHVGLFCGAGGFNQGFEQAGFRTVFAGDKYANATRTFLLNHPRVPEGNVFTVKLEDVDIPSIQSKIKLWADQLAKGKVHVLTAGIPCQGFSKAGYRSRPNKKYDVKSDPRNQLYRIVVQWTKTIEPRYVVIENVPGIRSAGVDEENILKVVKDAFEKIGYLADFGTVNSVNFGVAQVRHRFILIASHPDVKLVKVRELEGYHSESLVLRNVVERFPSIGANEGQWYARLDGVVVTGHRARYNNPDDLKIYAAMEPGERYIDFVERKKDIIKDRKLSTNRAVYSTESFPDKYYKLRMDKPSRTIVAHLQRDGNGYIHPEQIRSITPREAASIQGFNDDFVFTGSKGGQFIQIGNAVPPPLAAAIALLLADKLGQDT